MCVSTGYRQNQGRRERVISLLQSCLTMAKTFDPKKISKVLEKSLEKNSIPSFLQVVNEIPKSASEKNLDRILKDEFRKDAPNVYRLVRAPRSVTGS